MAGVPDGTSENTRAPDRFWLRRHYPVLLIGIVAFTLRVLGLWWHLPYVLHPDEHHVVNVAVGFGSKDLNPHQFIYGSLTMYVDLVGYGFYYVFERLTGVIASVDDFGLQFVRDVTPFYLIARGVSALCGTATVIVVYAIGTRTAGTGAGVIAAALLAVYPLHVDRSALALPDAPVTLLSALAIWAVVRAGDRWWEGRTALGVGVLSGFATAAKLLGVLSYGFFVIYALMAWREVAKGAWVRAVGVSVLGLLIGAFVGQPYAFLDHRSFGADMAWQHQMNLIAAGSSVDVLRREVASLWDQAGIASALVLLASLIVVWGTHSRASKALLVWGTGYLLFLAVQARYQSNWLLPAIPALTVVVGVTAQRCLEAIGLPPGRRGAGRAVGLVTAVLCAQPALQSGQAIAARLQPDSRPAAEGWIEEHVPDGSHLLLDGADWALPRLQESEASVEREIRQAEATQAASERYTHLGKYLQYRREAARRAPPPKYILSRYKHMWWLGSESLRGQVEDFGPVLYHPGGKTLQSYLDDGVQYVVTNDTYAARYNTPEFPTDQRFYADLARTGKLLVTIRVERNPSAPLLSIWRLPSLEAGPRPGSSGLTRTGGTEGGGSRPGHRGTVEAAMR